MSKHTPTPWIFVADDNMIYSENAFIFVGQPRSTVLSVEERNANGEFIVRACNSHDALVEKLRANHRAVDWLMAKLIELDPEFMPSKSPIWPDVKGTHDLLQQMVQP